MTDHAASVAAKEYLKILELAAKESESAVDGVLRVMIDEDMKIEFATVEDLYESDMTMSSVKDVSIPRPDLAVYDELRHCEMAGVQ